MLSLATSRRPSSLPSICDPIWEIIMSRCEGAIWLSIMQSEYLSDSKKLPASISICIGLCRTFGGKMPFTSGLRLLNGANQCATDWKNEKPLSEEKLDVEREEIGSLVLAFGEEDERHLEKL